MKIIVCLDDGGGMTFNKRRQSRDRILLADIKSMTEGETLFASPFSEKLLNEHEIDAKIKKDPLKKADRNDFCFIEDIPVRPFLSEINEIIIYKWNRRYPTDMTFDILPLSDGFTLSSVAEFAGSSHEKITKEIYTK